MEAGEGRAERRRRRRRFGGGSHDALRRRGSPQWCRGTAHRVRHQDRSADTGARESPGGQVASPSPGEVREGAARETDILRRGWARGYGVGVGRRPGTSKHVGKSDRPSAATPGRRHGGGNRGRRWLEGLRGAGASGRSRILRQVVNVVVDDELVERLLQWDANRSDRDRLIGVGRAARWRRIDLFVNTRRG